MKNKYYQENGLKMQLQNKCPMEVIPQMTGLKVMDINFGDQGIIATEEMEPWDNFA